GPHGHFAGRLRLSDPRRPAGGADGSDACRDSAAVSALDGGLFHLPRVRCDVQDVTRLALFGGGYSHSRAPAAALARARRWGADGLYALGDFGAFGPHPDRVFPLILDAGVESILGNYEESLSTGAEDCHCGYTDPRDNHFARISYAYTAEKTSPEWKRW